VPAPPHRELSPYGRDLCAEHLCPSHQYLTEGERRLVAAVLDDWYLYGLVITDLDLVRESLKLVADRVGCMPSPEDDLDLVRESLKLVADRVGCMPSPEDLRRGAFKRALAEFFSLKEHWPFRDQTGWAACPHRRIYGAKPSGGPWPSSSP